jgi:hypothetical protein
MRRAALEMAVHLWDVEGIVGLRRSFWSTSHLTASMSWRRVFGRREPGGPTLPSRALVIRPTDVDGAWTLSSPAGAELDRTEVRATTSDLFLRLWGRATGTFTGSIETLDAWATAWNKG